MEKIVTISGKDFKLKSSAFTPFAYKNDTGRDLLQDINKINKLYKEVNEITDEVEKNQKWLDELTDILETVLKIVYVMVKEGDKSTPSYEDWLRSLDDVMSDSGWIYTALQIGLAPFSGQLQNNQNN